MSRIYDETVDAIAAAINQAAQAATQNLPYDISYQGVVKGVNGNHRYTVTVEGKDYDVKALNQQVYEVGDRVVVQWPCSADHNKYILGSMSGSGVLAAADTSEGTIYGVVLKADAPLIELTIDGVVYYGKALAVGSAIEDEVYFIGTCGTPEQIEAVNAANITVYTGAAVPAGYQIVLLIEGEVPTIDVPLLLVPAAALEESTTVMLSADAPLEIITIDGAAYVGKSLDIDIDDNDATVLVGVSDIATAAQREAAWKAGFMPYAGEEVPEGCDIFLIIKGVIPTIDIPIELTYANTDTETITLTNPGFAEDLTENTQMFDASGNLVTGTLAYVNRAIPNISIDSQGVILAKATQEAGRVAETGTETSTLQLPVQTANLIVPGVNQQTAIEAGTYALGDIIVEGDPNLSAENIKIDTVIFGVKGTLDQAQPEISVSGNGVIKAVADTKQSELHLRTQGDTEITPGVEDITAITAGIYTTGDIVVKGDANLIKDNIKKDIEIFGVVGSMIGNDIVLQNKTITPTLETQSISASTGYDALGTVTVQAMKAVDNAIPSINISDNGVITATVSQEEGYVQTQTTFAELSLDTQTGQTFIPATLEQTIIGKGVYTTGDIKIAAMDVVTQAIPTISVDSSGKVTAEAVQSAGYVYEGTQSTTTQLTTQIANTITPGVDDQTVVSKGVYTTGDVIVKGDSNLKSENILSGVSIFGVEGTGTTGTKIAEGTFSSSGSSSGFTISGLGFTPSRLILSAPNTTTSSNVVLYLDTGAANIDESCLVTVFALLINGVSSAAYTEYCSVTFHNGGFTITTTGDATLGASDSDVKYWIAIE